MRDRPNAPTNPSVDALIADGSLKIVWLTLVIIAVSTLYPFKFILPDQASIQDILEQFYHRSSYLDIVANIILFAPLGFGIGARLARRPIAILNQLLVVALVSGGCSFLIEILQVFLPGRAPTPMDVVSNTLGGIVGFAVFQIYGKTIFTLALPAFQNIRYLLTKVPLPYLAIALVLYIGLASWLVVGWQGSSLKGWYDGFYLSVGNNYSHYSHRLQREINGAWKGSVADVVILDQALARSQVTDFLTELTPFKPRNPSVVAAYSLRGSAGGKDLKGQSPDLVWQGQPATMSLSTGAELSGSHWLRSETPLTTVTNQIRQTSQFTISALIQADEIASSTTYLQQIIALATPRGIGNFSISQSQSNLNLVLAVQRVNRSSRSNFQSVEDVFQDLKPHRFIVTYSGFVVRVYVDNADQGYVLDLTPNRFQIMLYLLILVPLALLIGLMANRLHHRWQVYLILVSLGTVLPALILEGFLAGEGDRTIRIANLLLGILIMGSTILILQGNFTRPRPIAT